MPDIAIRADNVSKRYRIGLREERHNTLVGAAIGFARQPLRNLRNLRRLSRFDDAGAEDLIWALKDVSFEIKCGDVVGVIGRNGAGKSTLLKILSRITFPTGGRILLRGRVSSLLEVGTGFHPELTGRENVYLNGTILGMRKAEIDRRFEEIIDFSGAAKFADTPVKRYSSGMHVRLAFAVAAHLEPEILLVDEVLAVGDAPFQKKCLGKMGDVARGGRTVLFVSHNMAAVQNLCPTAIFIEDGRLVFQGSTDSVIRLYLESMTGTQEKFHLAKRADRRGDQTLRFTRVIICDDKGNELKSVLSGQNALIRCYYVSSEPIRGATVGVSFVVRDGGYTLSNINSIDSGYGNLEVYEEGYFECNWERLNLASGTYDCSLYCSINGRVADWIESAFTIHVEKGDFFGSGKSVGVQSRVLVPHSWASHSS